MTKYLDSTGLSRLWSKVKALVTAHMSNKSNPHGVTKAQVGLGNVDNTSDASKSVYESRLMWGGKNIDGDVSVIDAAILPNVSANAGAFSKPDGVTVEYSNDSGSTWTDYGAADDDKVAMLTNIDRALFFTGKHNTYADVSTSDLLRITIDAQKCGFYVRVKKVCLWLSTQGANDCKVKIEKSLFTADGTVTFSEIGTFAVWGWSGWNSIPLGDLNFGGYGQQIGNCQKLRFTFSIGSKNSNSSYSSSLRLQKMVFIGTNHHYTNSNMASINHLYSYDVNQNATFPAQVTATQFNGLATRANADSDGNTISTTYIKSSDATDATNTEIDTMIANDSDGQYVLLKSDVTNADIDAMMT